MLRAAYLLLAGLLVSSCGDEQIGARAHLTLELPVFASTDLLTVSVLAPELSDGGTLDCQKLDLEQVAIDDAKVTLLATASERGSRLESGDVELKLEKIAAGENRIFVAEVRADNGSGARRGFGCVAGIKIEANKDVAVTLSVHELP